jgi:hypothetical protein
MIKSIGIAALCFVWLSGLAQAQNEPRRVQAPELLVQPRAASAQPQPSDKKALLPAIDMKRPEIGGVHKKHSGPPAYFQAHGRVFGFPATPILYGIMYQANATYNQWPGTVKQPTAPNDSPWECRYYEYPKPIPYDNYYVVLVESATPKYTVERTFLLSAAGSFIPIKAKYPTLKAASLPKIEKPPGGTQLIAGESRIMAEGKMDDAHAHLPLFGVIFSPSYPDQTVILGSVKQHGKNWKIEFEIPETAAAADDYVLRVGPLQGDVARDDRTIKIKAKRKP